jgi:hypothetical protein
MTASRVVALCAAVTIAAMAVAGCNGELGSNPSCSAFMSASSADQLKAATALAHSKGQSNGATVRLSALAFCNVYPDRHIEGIYHG